MILSAFFSSTEAAFLSLDRIAITRIKKSQSFINRRISYFLNHFELLITTLLFFNLLVNTSAGLVSKLITDRILFMWPGMQNNTYIEYTLPALVFIMTFIVLTFGEITPKRFSIKFAKTFVVYSVLPFYFFYYMIFPISWIANRITKNFVNIFIKSSKNISNAISENELKTFIKIGFEKGTFEKIESQILLNLISYSDTTVKTIMIPWQKLQKINILDMKGNLARVLKKFNEPAILVYKGTRDNIIGVIEKKEAAYKILSNGGLLDLKSIVKNVSVVPENKSIVELLKQLFENEENAALVVDEFGGTEGLVTYENIVSKLIGAMEGNDINERMIKKIAPTVYDVHPHTTIDEFNEYFKTNIQCGDAETIGGYIIEKYHNIPKTNELIMDRHFEYKIKRSDKRQILKLMVRKLK